MMRMNEDVRISTCCGIGVDSGMVRYVGSNPGEAHRLSFGVDITVNTEPIEVFRMIGRKIGSRGFTHVGVTGGLAEACTALLAEEFPELCVCGGAEDGIEVPDEFTAYPEYDDGHDDIVRAMCAAQRAYDEQNASSTN